MRARILPGWLLGIMLAGGAVASSFAQDGLNPSQTAVLPDKTGPAVPPPAAAASVEAGTPPNGPTAFHRGPGCARRRRRQSAATQRPTLPLVL